MKVADFHARRRLAGIIVGAVATISLGAAAVGTVALGNQAVVGSPLAADHATDADHRPTATQPAAPSTQMLPPATAQAVEELFATPGAAEQLQTQLQEHLGADSAGVTSAHTGGGVVQALEYGVDGDHFWIKATVGDIAGGVLSTLCARLGPAAPLCKVLVDVIINWYESNHPTHGVWGEIYRSGQIRVGGW